MLRSPDPKAGNWEDDAVRRDIAIAAALPRTVNQDVLTVIAPAGRARELFGWLREMPFVSPRGDSWAYHDVVRTAMLRWQRAAAPAEWRSVHNLLAAANAGWARQVVAGTSSAWTSPECIDYLREETYHLLCANPHGNLHGALTSAVRAAEHGAIRARQWAALLADAGRDSGNDQLKVWGQRLADGIRGGDLSSYLTCLIDDGSLDTSALIAALEQRGEAHRLAGRFGEALTDLTRAIQADPGRASAIASRGETYRALRRNDEALADFNRAIELNPGYAWAIGSRGQIYRVTRRYDDAIGDFDRAIELNPNYVWGIGSRGQTYHDMRRYDDAVADFSRAIELNPNYVWGIGSRGQTYRDMGRFDDALADFNRAIELKPWHAWTIASRGETYRLMGRYDEALRDLNHVIEHDPADVWAIGHRGQAYQAMGRYEEALRDLNRAIELDPELDWAIVSRDEIFSAIDDGATPG